MMEPPGEAVALILVALMWKMARGGWASSRKRSSGRHLDGLCLFGSRWRGLRCLRRAEAGHELLRRAHDAVRDEKNDRHEHPSQHEDPQVRVVGRQLALEPVHAEGPHYGPDKRSPTTDRDPNDH